MRHGRHNPVYARMGAYNMAGVLERRNEHLERYVSMLAERIPPSKLQYWKKYGCIAPDTLRKDNDDTFTVPDEHSLHTFPGRKRCREGIVFEKFDRQVCAKKFFKGPSIVATLITVQCTCAHPKMIEFAVLRECE